MATIRPIDIKLTIPESHKQPRMFTITYGIFLEKRGMISSFELESQNNPDKKEYGSLNKLLKDLHL